MDPTVVRDLAALFAPHTFAQPSVQTLVRHVELNLRHRPDYAHRPSLTARALAVVEHTQIVQARHDCSVAAQKIRNWQHAANCDGCGAGHQCTLYPLCPLFGKCLGSLRRHIRDCGLQHCPVPHCAATRLVLRHFHGCRTLCGLCTPFRQTHVLSAVSALNLRAHLAAFPPFTAHGCVLCSQTDLVVPNSVYCDSCSAEIPVGAPCSGKRCKKCAPHEALAPLPAALDATAECTRCLRFVHHVCALLTRPHADYVCPHCMLADPLRRPLARFFPAHVDYIQRRIEEPNVRVQLLARTAVQTAVEPRARLLLDMPDVLPGFETCYGLFTVIDGVDVLIFVFYTLEYGADCPEPNRNRVYLNYVDSVNYFQPKERRTTLYHRALLAYLQDAGNRGFRTCHIWSCPPHRRDEYIFVGHPPAQKKPTKKKLLDWYLAMARTDSVPVSLFADEFKHAVPPYFPGDLWALEIGKAKSVAAAWTAFQANKKYCLVLALERATEAPPLTALLDSCFATRLTFIQFCRENHLHFASLLSAKHATAFSAV